MTDNEIVGKHKSEIARRMDIVQANLRKVEKRGDKVAMSEWDKEGDFLLVCMKLATGTQDTMYFLAKGRYDGDLEAISQAITNRIGGK